MAARTGRFAPVPQAGPTEAFAAEELRDALKKISGADFEILVSATLPDRRAIVIGDLENPHVRSRADALNLRPDKVEEVAVYTLEGNLYLAGNQPRAALYAVYCFLQNELQVRAAGPGATENSSPPRKAGPSRN